MVVSTSLGTAVDLSDLSNEVDAGDAAYDPNLAGAGLRRG